MQQYADVVTDRKGNVVPGAVVSILKLDGTLATLFDAAGSPLANPVTADALGYFAFAAANGAYRRSIVVNGSTVAIPGQIILEDPVDVYTTLMCTRAASGAVPCTLDDMFKDRISVMEFLSIAQRLDVRSGRSLVDCSAAIQECLDHVNTLPAQYRPEIYVPAGRYLLLSPLQMHDNITLRGVRRDTGYWYAFNHSSEFIAGTAMLCMINITATNDYIGDLGLYGNTVAQYGLYTHVPVGQARTSSGTYERISITQCSKSNIHLFNKGLVKGNALQLSAAVECALDLSNTGDNNFTDLYINSNNPDSTSTVNGPSSATVYGVGVRIRDASGNINFIGGKVEFNRIGFLMNNVDGVNMLGMQFDTNRGGDVVIIGDSMTAGAPTTENAGAVTSVQITGCRMLGGTEGSQGTTAAVLVRNARTVTLSGNSIKRAGDSARDFATDTTQGHQYGVWLDNAELCTVTGNNLYGAGVVACLKITSDVAATAQHTVSGNQLDNNASIQSGTVRDTSAYSNQIFAAGMAPIAANTAKAWMKFNGTTNAIIAGIGFAAVTGSAGTYAVTFSSARADANYAVLVSVRKGTGYTDSVIYDGCSTTGFNIYTLVGGTPTANAEISVMVFSL